MKIPNPYFRSVGTIGDLVLEHMIFEAEYPVLFVCKDKLDKKYICVCCDIRKTQRWIVSPISTVDLVKMLSDKLTLRDAFLTKESENSYLIEWDPQHPDIENVTPVSIFEIPDEDLPTAGEFIEAEEDEYKDIILKLKDVDNEREVMLSGTSIVNDFEYEAIKVQKFFALDDIDTKTITYCDTNNFYAMNTFEITETKPLMKQVLIPSKKYKLIVDRVEKEAPILFNKKGELNFSTKLEDNCYVYAN